MLLISSAKLRTPVCRAVRSSTVRCPCNPCFRVFFTEAEMQKLNKNYLLLQRSPRGADTVGGAASLSVHEDSCRLSGLTSTSCRSRHQFPRFSHPFLDKIEYTQSLVGCVSPPERPRIRQCMCRLREMERICSEASFLFCNLR